MKPLPAGAVGRPVAAGERPGADDWALLARAGDQDALGTLFDRHRDYVYRLAWSTTREAALAEDVTQEVFLRISCGYRRWRPRAAFRTWLYRVVVNTARELVRRHRRLASNQDLGSAGRAEPSVASPDASLTDLTRALRSLPERQREVVILRYLEGMSTRETAQAMRCRAGTVKTHLHRALRALRNNFAAPAGR